MNEERAQRPRSICRGSHCPSLAQFQPESYMRVKDYNPIYKIRSHDSILYLFFLMWQKAEFLLRVEIPLTNTEGMIKLEQYHLVTIIIVVTHSAKNQWILKAVGESLSSYRIFTVSKNLPTRHLLITEGKTSDFTLEKPGSTTSLHHMVEVRITRNETSSHPVPPERMH